MAPQPPSQVFRGALQPRYVWRVVSMLPRTQRVLETQPESPTTLWLCEVELRMAPIQRRD